LETPYKAVSFVKHDIITRSTLDQLQQNYQWIHENTPRGKFYREQGEPKMTNVRLIAGKKEIGQNKKGDTATVRVNFGGKVFHPNCKPSITTGVVADFQRKIFCVVHGPAGINYPNADGFQITVNIASDNEKDDVIKKSFWVHWQALGFRTDDMNEF